MPFPYVWATISKKKSWKVSLVVFLVFQVSLSKLKWVSLCEYSLMLQFFICAIELIVFGEAWSLIESRLAAVDLE